MSTLGMVERIAAEAPPVEVEAPRVAREARPAVSAEIPQADVSAPEVLGALGALAGLALCAAPVGSVTWADLVWVAWVPACWLGAAMLAAPPLLVATELLHLRWTIADVLQALLRGVVRSGRLAAALAPVSLLFVATSSVGEALTMFFLGAVALPGLVTTVSALLDRVGWDERGLERVILLMWTPLLAAIGGRLLLQPLFGAW